MFVPSGWCTVISNNIQLGTHLKQFLTLCFTKAGKQCFNSSFMFLTDQRMTHPSSSQGEIQLIEHWYLTCTQPILKALISNRTGRVWWLQLCSWILLDLFSPKLVADMAKCILKKCVFYIWNEKFDSIKCRCSGSKLCVWGFCQNLGWKSLLLVSMLEDNCWSSSCLPSSAWDSTSCHWNSCVTSCPRVCLSSLSFETDRANKSLELYLLLVLHLICILYSVCGFLWF